MLFSSHFFLLVFLPLSLIIFFLCSRIHSFLGLLSIVILSTIFYGWHNPYAVFLVWGSMILNYKASQILLTNNSRNFIFFAILVFNVSLLLFFKYLDFFIENINVLFSLHLKTLNLPLPLAISFFTFQQISFIVHIYKKQADIPKFLEYTSFILFFPQLIAGPIVKHSDYLPQIQNSRSFLPSFRNCSIGATIFALGLFKKTILADGLSIHTDHIFGLVANGVAPNLIEAWLGVLGYTFQIYFDFSGYSDMAIGLARMFNIHLPVNFFSPYKATSIIDFWRRWHISLSSFLKEHIYIPLGGNKRGAYFRYQNLMITMLIGGLWHGANWTFVIWGALHGICLVINHIIRAARANIVARSTKYWCVMKRVFVFLLIAIIWIFFRVHSLTEAKLMLSSMFSWDHLIIPKNYIRFGSKCGIDLTSFAGEFHIHHEERELAILFLLCSSVIVFFLPTIYEWMGYFLPAKDFVKTNLVKQGFFKKICWKPTFLFGFVIFVLFVIAFGNIDVPKEFIYFRF